MDTLLKNLILIDGTGRDPVVGGVIVIREGKILYAGSAPGWKARVEHRRNEAKDDAFTLDLQGRYVLPG